MRSSSPRTDALAAKAYQRLAEKLQRLSTNEEAQLNSDAAASQLGKVNISNDS